ncbi:hypothetical protein GCM10008939_10220 [Deinococcus aquiradiocola]|uniref:Uncharacterized protein n=2 Tax=Deinococcus aquiradiocola TaxID=393059 RepID=A0A917UMB8_9DEIO|nr:hypothetical protein GCM10008939_10220 [Deinococcus aquiradiocola]
MLGLALLTTLLGGTRAAQKPTLPVVQNKVSTCPTETIEFGGSCIPLPQKAPGVFCRNDKAICNVVITFTECSGASCKVYYTRVIPESLTQFYRSRLTVADTVSRNIGTGRQAFYGNLDLKSVFSSAKTYDILNIIPDPRNSAQGVMYIRRN